MAATHHRHGSRTLPRRPSAHADPTTPAGENGFFGRLLPRPRRPSPSGRRVGSSEKLSRPAQGSRAFGLRICTSVAPRTSPEASGGDLSPHLLEWLPGEPTIPRAG